MKKRFLTLFATGLLACSLTFTAFPSTVKAEPTTEESTEIGDELSYILNMDTSKSAETPSQVTAKFQIPSGFGLNVYMDILHDDGTMYRILATDANGYTDFAFVKEGHYIVMTSGVVDDAANRYTFSLSHEDFVVDAAENSVLTVTATSDQYDEIAQIIAERTGEGPQELEDTENSQPQDNQTQSFMEKMYKTNIEGVYIGSDGVLYYDTVSNSKVCTAQVYGNANGTYDLYFEVIKAGVIGEAEFKVSLDGGQTFIGTDISANDYSFSSRGLYIKFTTEKDTDELEVGDTFTASVPETFKVNTSHYSQEPNMIVTGHPEENYQVLVTILSTGPRGVAKYSLSYNNGSTTEFIGVIPEDGVAEHGELTLQFADADFAKGVTYTCEVKSNIDEVSYVPLYIMCGIVAVLAIAAYVWLTMQKEKPNSYRIRTWKDHQDKEKYE
jgi:hypothetical protein